MSAKTACKKSSGWMFCASGGSCPSCAAHRCYTGGAKTTAQFPDGFVPWGGGGQTSFCSWWLPHQGSSSSTGLWRARGVWERGTMKKGLSGPSRSGLTGSLWSCEGTKWIRMGDMNRSEAGNIRWIMAKCGSCSVENLIFSVKWTTFSGFTHGLMQKKIAKWFRC